ncbi:tetratricopeptide repeat protein [Aestuariibacter halophilus]|uniref:Ancillary SecYEG translocon subunit n=1 Tax=Fluctibacter halophilus TaxID=226011 RepID=A0ABS8G3C3_9ALTE|nr:tetratricopeptide repeat protein [Aestuariibacter halophilus]MCC2614958.1 tetratricopeptide repeat protein [Aestuariibacter halophilus]
MEQFATEEQQVEAIKRFWKENGIAIIVGAAVGLGGLWGWRYYNAEQIQSKEMASLTYQQQVEALAQDGQNSQALASFVEQNEGKGYDILGAFMLAKAAVDSDKLDEAASQLNVVINRSEQVAVQDVARLRLARIYSQQANNEQALATLDAVTTAAFDGQVQEIRGDVYAAMGQFDQAKTAYVAALAQSQSNRLVEMKLDNLAVLATQQDEE